MASAKNTAHILRRLREVMKNTNYLTEPIQAYIIPTDDQHQDEYISDHYKRREYVSGFKGSAGTAIVTANEAAMWADGRYHLQAEKEMDSNWTLMKLGLTDTITEADWLAKVLPEGAKIGTDPYLFSAARWKPLNKQLKGNGQILVPVMQNLVDIIWDDQPEAPNNPVFVHPMKFAGRSWQNKIKDVLKKMTEKKASVLVLTALDEIAWLFNLRGSDVSMVPIFFAYAVVTAQEASLFIDRSKFDKSVHTHLNSNDVLSGEEDRISLKIYPYEDIMKFLDTLPETIEKGKIWVSDKSSFAIFNTVPKTRRFVDVSPVALLKAVKNSAELDGMKRAHVKDAVTLCEYFSWLEKEVPKGTVTEVSAATKLEKIKSSQEDYVELSFNTISSSGPNAAVIHYCASEETDRPVTVDEIYLCDSGAHYSHGTTDVTRTMHFGTPSNFEKESFTRVAKGHIALASSIFPKDVKGHVLDVLARTSLWNVGLDYLHGTGHGVGAFLGVHEGPIGISPRGTTDSPLQENMVLSNEPGYYEDGKFGIRIENLYYTKKIDTPYNYKDKGWLTFESLTLVPIQQKMLDPSILTQKEIDWINDYHVKCRDIVGEELKRQGKDEAFDWMIRQTQPLA